MKSLTSHYLHSLNDRQREAVLTTQGPLIVLAGAGSGKTKMLTSRISYLVEELKVPAHQILAVTFTNKAAGEMRHRVEKNLGIASPSASSWNGFGFDFPEIGTFHSICLRILRREMVRTPFTKPFVIYDDSDQLSLIKGTLAKLNLDEKSLNPKVVQAAINRAKCDALEPHEVKESPHSFFDRQFKLIYDEYQKSLFLNHAIDFGEIICFTYRLLRDQLDLREKYQKRFRYIHVDEYQDTNRAQYLLLSILASCAQGGGGNICVVGDEDQSIYKWRGADIRNILDFEKDYPGAHVVKLEQNYRSTQTILAVAGHVIRNNRSRKDKTLWTENERGAAVIRAQLADERAEAEMVIAEIRRLAVDQNRAFSDFAIFYRTNAQSRQFEDVFRREKIPYQIVGGLRFYDRKEIKDILSYFKVVLNLADSIALKRIINVPARGIGKTTLEKLDALVHSGQTPLWDVLVQASSDSHITSTGTARKIGQFVSLVQKLVEVQPQKLLSELYHLILDETGYVRELRQEGTEEALSRIENLEEFGTLLQEFEEDQLEKLSPEDQVRRKSDLLMLFLEQISLDASMEVDPERSESSVKLMTLHSSKGLEFPVVFLVGMEEGLFPSLKPWEETPEEEIEEERRLCYVGMTRARELLYLVNVVIRRIWGNVSYQEPSRFFAEMPDDGVELRDLSMGHRAYRIGSSRQFVSKTEPSQSAVIRRESSAGKSAGKSGGSTGGSSGEWIGLRVNHPEYGTGTIVLSEGSGTDQKISIQFQGKQQKKFLLRYISHYVER